MGRKLEQKAASNSTNEETVQSEEAGGSGK